MRILVGVLLLGLITACAPVPGAPQSTATAMPLATASALEVKAQAIVAEWLDVPLEMVRVTSNEPVEWPDTSLGCPQAGVAYAQVIMPGYRIRLEAAGETYVVHTDAGGLTVICGEDGSPVEPLFPVTPGSIDDGQPWLPVY
ncbi:MAG TPA: hypothetical protein VFI11_03170 [Anaerolineales bacterium]|nr:hypothetical protein [Anaerolineales bacterium]